MFDELQQKSLQERKYVKHPYISFVFIHNTKYFCTKHPSHDGMNRGAIKQHLRGKAHRLNFDTGNPINKVDVSEINQVIMESSNQDSRKIKSEMDYFLELYHKIPMICSLKDRAMASLIAKHTLEGEIRDELLVVFGST